MSEQYLVSHRGAAGLAPENTLAAFKIGLDSKADVVECDIHLSKDRELVVFHDNTVNRTTDGSGWLHELTLRDLQKLDAGNGERIATLIEIAEMVSQTDKKLIIEIKGPFGEEVIEVTEKLNDFLLKYPAIAKQIYVHSFWLEAVKRFKVLNPAIKTYLVIMSGLPLEKLLDLLAISQANGISIAYDYVSRELVAKLHAQNMAIDAWLLNDHLVFQRMKEMGVDGLITNYPDRFQL